LAGSLFSQDNEVVELDQHYLFLAYWKSRALVPNDDEIEKYIYISEKQKYTNTRNNEILWKRLMNETKTVTDELIKTMDFNTVFSGNGSIEIITYDFDKQGFVINTEQYTMYRFLTLNYNYENIYIGFDNFKEFNFFPIEEDEAEMFLSKIMDSRGNLNKKVNTMFHFKFRLCTNDERKKLARNNEDNGFSIMASIEKMEFYTTLTAYQKAISNEKLVKIGELAKK
jgi:hypothetical protein